MRNPFDQYNQPENRLTHALACTLEADRSLIRPFLAQAGIREVPPEPVLQITQQQVPGVPVSGDESDGERKGVPDACIYAPDGWAVLIEAKVQAGVSADQLRRHAAFARRCGFARAQVVLLSVDPPPPDVPDGTVWFPWREVYRWFRERASDSLPAQTFTQYMEVFESRMIARDYAIRGTITMFDGLRFDEESPYTYSAARRQIRLLGDELQKRPDLHAIGVDPEGERRGKITGSAGPWVWDFLPLVVARNAQFTSFPHLTLSLGRDYATAAITIPNGVAGLRTRLRDLGQEAFIGCLRGIEERIRPVLARSAKSKCMVYIIQRHFQSQNSPEDVDARMDADLRTLVPGGRDGTKHQPEWVEALYQVLVNKRSNIQLGLETHFQYACPVVRSPEIVELFVQAWIAMFPIVAEVRGTRTASVESLQ